MTYPYELSADERLSILDNELPRKSVLDVMKVVFIIAGVFPAALVLFGGLLAVIQREDGALFGLIGGFIGCLFWAIPIGYLLPFKVFGNKNNTTNIIVENINTPNITARVVCIDSSEYTTAANRHNVIHYTDDNGRQSYARANFECAGNQMAGKNCLILFAKLDGREICLKEAFVTDRLYKGGFER